MPKSSWRGDGKITEGDIGITESVSRSIPIVLNEIDLQFFPEGGELTDGLQSKVAFKALNEFGKAADIKGDV